MNITTADVWLFMQANCNLNEIAAYAQVSHRVAAAMMKRAALDFSQGLIA